MNVRQRVNKKSISYQTIDHRFYTYPGCCVSIVGLIVPLLTLKISHCSIQIHRELLYIFSEVLYSFAPVCLLNWGQTLSDVCSLESLRKYFNLFLQHGDSFSDQIDITIGHFFDLVVGRAYARVHTVQVVDLAIDIVEHFVAF